MVRSQVLYPTELQPRSLALWRGGKLAINHLSSIGRQLTDLCRAGDTASGPGELPLLIRAYGRDRPQMTANLLRLLGDAGAVLEDMEQLVVRERLTLDVLVRLLS